MTDPSAIVSAMLPRLRAGKTITIDAADLGDLEAAPEFRKVGRTLAWPVGQTADYVWSCKDGRRVHVQIFDREGAAMAKVHLDRWDPTASILNLLAHGLLETPIGPAIVTTGVVVLARPLRRRVSRAILTIMRVAS